MTTYDRRDLRKHLVREILGDVSIEQFAGSIENAITQAEKLREYKSGEYLEIELVPYYDDYEAGFRIEGVRKETLKERSKRLKVEARERKKAQKAKERRIERIKRQAQELGLKIES